jgi:hypothetical protein
MNNEKVQTQDIKIGNLELEPVRIKWLGMRDSNPRILVPETSALPLGESPI